jgi:hypothetical protein
VVDLMVIGDKSVHPTACEILEATKGGPTVFNYCCASYDCACPRRLKTDPVATPEFDGLNASSIFTWSVDRLCRRD